MQKPEILLASSKQIWALYNPKRVKHEVKAGVKVMKTEK